MLIAALCAFAAAAVAGVFLAIRHFMKKKLPASVALIHGLGGATGFTFVLLVVAKNPDFRLARQALYLFIVTVLLGAVNLLFHLRNKRHRTSLIVVHALVAVSGVLTLLFAILGGQPSTAAQSTAKAPRPSAAPPTAPAEVAKAPEPTASASASGETAAAPAPAEKGPSTAAELELDPAVRAVLGQPIHFGTESAAVSPESLPTLTEIVKALKAHPEVLLVEVQGHADQRGDDARNVALTQTRAAGVLEALVARGIDRARLHSAGYGARCPANVACIGATPRDSCSAPESFSVDRRVVLVPLRAGTTSLAGKVVCDRGADLIPPADKPFQR